MLPLYSAVLSSDGLFADLIDLRGLYGAGRLRLTVDRGSVRLSAGAAPDALDVIGDYGVGVFEVSIPLTRLVKAERLTGNSSTILVEILPHTADKRNVTATLSNGGSVLDAVGQNAVRSALVSPQLVAVVCGNSIAVQCRRAPAGYWVLKSELHHANMLAGSPMRFKRMMATTRSDAWGVYGHSGQTIPTILGDMDAQWMTPLAAAGITPDLVVGHALLENDIATGRTYAQIVASLTTWIRTIQARWPGAMIHLVTPRPSFSYNTAAIVQVYQQVRDYMLSLDNGYSIFVSRGDVYENPAIPGTPLGTSGAPIYTDSSAHPNAAGALLLGREQARTLRRIARAFKSPGYAVSTNIALVGSVAATGTNVAGTMPTSTTISGSANGTYVATAGDPGFGLQITVGATGGSAPLDLSTLNFGAVTLSGVTQISPFITVQLTNGAENLRSIELAPRVADGGGNTFQYFVQQQTGDAEPMYQNGDTLTLVCPPLIANSGAITGCTNYVRTVMKLAGGSVTWQMIAQGVQIIA